MTGQALGPDVALVTFDGTELDEPSRALIRDPAVAGVSIARHRNVRDPGQVRALVEEVQAVRGEGTPLIVGTDQEGGQLSALGPGFTPFAGNMALGAAGDPGLAERVAEAIGRELRAVGVNVNYAPVCDLATTVENVSLGIRSFGEDPAAAAELAAATARGLASARVVATAKHFPGSGDIVADPHHELPAIAHVRERLGAVEGRPFRAAVEAGAGVVMLGHAAIPSVTGRADLPTSVSRAAIDLLRESLGPDVVALTDAMNMRALGQGPSQVVEAIAALRAGADLLLLWDDVEVERGLLEAVGRAAARGLLDAGERSASRSRIERLRGRLGSPVPPDLGGVGGAEHLALARELAARSVTLVRDDAGLLPIPTAGGRIAVVAVRSADLTPADTSSTVEVELGAAIRARHPEVDVFSVAHRPAEDEVADIRSRVRDHDLIVLGTIEAFRDPRQTALVAAMHEAGPPVVWAALRTPWDLTAFPGASTYVCTYGILRPSLDALASALVGAAPFAGRLPVTLDGRYARGHGIKARDRAEP